MYLIVPFLRFRTLNEQNWLRGSFLAFGPQRFLHHVLIVIHVTFEDILCSVSDRPQQHGLSLL